MTAPRVPIRHLIPDTGITCFVIPGLFTAAECEALLSPQIRNSFQRAITNYPGYYRNNDRFVLDSEPLAAQLFEKVAPYLPAQLDVAGDIPAEHGRWHLQELNSRLRFCRYSAGQYFHRHLDGIHYRDADTQSKLTFMIYLNGAPAFEGGRTLFYRTKDDTQVWAAYTPEAGDLIVFDHNVWHEGEALRSGEKFVLRSDILYRRRSAGRLHAPFSGHLGYIWSLLKLDEDTIISGGRDRQIKVWSAAGELRQSLDGHESSILCLAKLDARTFISGSRDRRILVWRDFHVVATLEVHSAVVLSLCRLDGQTFASGSGDATIRICRSDGSELRALRGHTDWVLHLVRLDDDTIASCSGDGTIRIWDLRSGEAIRVFTEPAPVFRIAFNPSTRTLISGDLHGTLSLRNLDDAYEETRLRRLPAHTGIIRSIRIIDELRFASGGEDNQVRIWSLAGEPGAAFRHHNFVQAIEMLDDDTLLTASYDGTIRRWPL